VRLGFLGPLSKVCKKDAAAVSFVDQKGKERSESESCQGSLGGITCQRCPARCAAAAAAAAAADDDDDDAAAGRGERPISSPRLHFVRLIDAHLLPGCASIGCRKQWWQWRCWRRRQRRQRRWQQHK
jgi:hypothetical protein